MQHRVPAISEFGGKFALSMALLPVAQPSSVWLCLLRAPWQRPQMPVRSLTKNRQLTMSSL
jgi:hypothetical protein